MITHYKSDLKKAIEEGHKLGLEPLPLENQQHTLDSLQKALKLAENVIHPLLIQKHPMQYWGEQCLNLSAQTYAILKHSGIACDIVFGDVRVNGSSYEYGTTIKALKKELNKGVGKGGIQIHAWVTVGDNYIIDFSIASRMQKKHGRDYNPYGLSAANPADFMKSGMEFIPMLAGASFLEKTCGINLNPLGNTYH